MRNFKAHINLAEARRAAPLVWGEHDCVAYACASAQAQTGVDIRARLGCTWTTEAGAARILRRRGGLAAATSGVLRQIPPAFAHRGDIGIVERDGRLSMVVIEGDLWSAPGETGGLIYGQRAEVMQAWSIDP